MLRQIQALLKLFLHAGLNGSLSPSFSKKIRLTNLVCLLLFAVTLPYAIIFTAIGATWLGAMIIPLSSAYLGLIRFNAIGYYSVSRLGIVTLFNTAVIVYSCSFGFTSGIHLLFFPLACLSLLLFDLEEHLYLLGSALVPIGLYLSFIYLNPAPLIALPQSTQEIIRYLLIPTTFIILLASVYYLQLANRHAEDELNGALSKVQSEIDRSHQIFDAIKDFIILRDQNARLIWGNKAFREFHGKSLEQLLNVDEPNFKPDMNSKSVRDELEVLKSGEFMKIDEESALRADGSTRWFSTIKTLILDLNGQPSMLVAVCRDITQQKEYDQIIAEQKSKMISSSRLSALGEMAAGIAHEINNPLTIILGRTSNLRRLTEKNPENIEQMREFASNIDSMAHRIARIVRGLRSFSRDAEQDPFVSTSLREIFQDTLDLCATRINAQGIKVELAPIPENFTIECRPVQISQILLNMIANAADAVEGAAEQWIRLSVQSSDSGYQIEVSDSGTGISIEAREKIFQPFFTTKSLGKGTGLGLSVTKGIVEAHRGQIRLDVSAPYTRFLIDLPKLQALVPVRTA